MFPFPAPLDAATIAGAAAVAINGSWPLLRSRRRILALQVLSSLLFGLHYFLLGAVTGRPCAWRAPSKAWPRCCCEAVRRAWACSAPPWPPGWP